MPATCRLVWLFTFVVIAVSRTAMAEPAPEDAKALVRQALEALPHTTFVAKLKLLTRGQEGRQLELRHKLINGVRSSYMEVVAPPDVAGIRFLFLESLEKPPVQYLRIPTAPRHLLVADDIRMRSFLDSAFYVADFVEPALDAFDFSIVGSEAALGRDCKLVQAVPRDPKKAVYARTVVAIDPKDLLILKRDFYDRNDKLFKKWAADAVEKVSGHWTQMKQTMINIEDKMESRLEVVEIEYDVVLDDAEFKPQYLMH